MGALDILVLLAITVGPTKAAAMYLALTVGADRELKRRIAIRTVVTASIVCLAFALAGRGILGLFHISLPAMLIAGGLILFVFAIQLVLGEEHGDAPDPPRRTPSIGLAAYPLAVPLMASPQGIVAITVISVQRPDFEGRIILIGLLLLVMATNLLVLLFAERIFSKVNPAVFQVVMRIIGLMLCGLAVQLCIAGLRMLQVLPPAVATP